MPFNDFAVNASVFASERGQKSVTVSGLKRGLVYAKNSYYACVLASDYGYGERRKGFEQE